MAKQYEKFIGPDGVVRIGHSLTRPEPKAAEQPKPEQRPVVPKVKPAQLGKAAQAAPQLTDAKPEQIFAGRLRAILALPEATTRQRQALAIAAETEAEPKEAAAILAALPEDRAAGFRHGGSLFPASAVKHDAEAQRIVAIMRSPEAEGREAAALSLALNTSLPLREVASVLSRTLQAAEKPKIPTIAERAAAEREFGGSYEPGRRGSSELWRAAVEKANSETFGDRAAAQPVAAAKQGTPIE